MQDERKSEQDATEVEAHIRPDADAPSEDPGVRAARTEDPGRAVARTEDEDEVEAHVKAKAPSEDPSAHAR
ncbi:MAG: hypothetical protein ACJ780_19580 [Solirubrobacteraceae bacterium]